MTKDLEQWQKDVVREASRLLYPARHPCVECGWHKAERHHPTYDSLSVVWLCKKCHATEHVAMRSRTHTK